MHNALARRHPVQFSGLDGLVIAQIVLVLDHAIIDPGDGGKANMRMRPHVHALPRLHQHRAKLVKENEWPHHLPLG